LKTNVPLSDVCPDLTFSFLNAGENNISSLLVNFDDFVLERKLAVGGFAEIFVGKQKRKEDEYSSEEKIFAVKVLLNQMKQVTLPPSPRRSSATLQDQPTAANISMPPTPRGSEAVASEVTGTVSPPPEEVIVSNLDMSQQQILQLQNLEQAKQSFAPKEVVGNEADELMDRESFSLLSETFRELQHEVFVMCHLRHPNIVTLHAISINPVALFMEFYPLGSLDNYLRAPIDGRSALSSSPRNAEKPKTLSWRYRVKVALDIAQGMNYLHGEDIIHRDLRSPNVLITDLNDGAEVVAKGTFEPFRTFD
jgi:serine/threonine protein kinase